MRGVLLRIKDDKLLALRGVSIVAVPVLMIVFSVAVPPLRNPLFLVVGGMIGSLLPGSWLSGSR